MRREGCDEENLEPTDFLCDYCGNHWTESRPMVEGHRGSLVCAPCLTVAYTQVILHAGGEDVPESEVCVMCMAHKDVHYWRSHAVEPTKVICAGCIRLAAKQFEKDPESGWSRPTA